MSDKQLSLDATGGDWNRPPIRVGDDGAIYVRDPTLVSGTRRIERSTPEWWERLADLDAREGAQALDSESRRNLGGAPTEIEPAQDFRREHFAACVRSTLGRERR
jgi:hypothetical protein